jgi:hypothetical protein
VTPSKVDKLRKTNAKLPISVSVTTAQIVVVFFFFASDAELKCLGLFMLFLTQCQAVVHVEFTIGGCGVNARKVLYTEIQNT